jgi:hypothetical protein
MKRKATLTLIMVLENGTHTENVSYIFPYAPIQAFYTTLCTLWDTDYVRRCRGIRF